MRELLASSRLSAAALVLIVSACKPDLPHTPTEKIVIAVFDPTASKIPLPNDLVFTANPNSVCPPPANTQTGDPACAQAELLVTFRETFATSFPSDQEVAITIEFSQTDFHDNGVTTHIAPALDFESFTSSTFFIMNLTSATEVPIDPPTDADYVKASDHGTLSIHHQGRTPWPPGKYAVLMRGGENGIKTIDGTPVSASQIFALIAQGKDMTAPENIGLLRAQTGSTAAAIAQGAQLNVLIGLYKATAFGAADKRFPHQELAIASTFGIYEKTNVTVDAGRGIVPLPIDLLRNPVTGRLSALAACTLAGAELDEDGTCPSAAAGGFQALDGFSTTGAILAPTSNLILAKTARTAGAVRLFDLSTSPPSEVPANNLIIEPCEFTVNPANGSSGCTDMENAVAPVIAIQPAGATAVDPAGVLPSVFRTKPLKERTDYAVVITNAVRVPPTPGKPDGDPIGPGTVASIVRFKNPIIKDGKSQLLGVDDGTAAALEKMRLQLQPLFAALPEADRSKVVMAYTFRTQTILSPAVQLAALPYLPTLQTPPSALPIAPLSIQTAADGFAKWGVDSNVVPSNNIDQILEVDIETVNALDPITGAFTPDPTKAPKEKIRVLIATPLAANVPDNPCLGGGPKCAPMIIFRHGLGSGRGDMLTVANTFAAGGMVTVAIDAAKHGDRSFCTSGTSGAASGCNNGGTCTTLLPAGAQGDATPPGTCVGNGFVKRPVSPTCAADPSPCPARADGIPVVSSNYLITTNFFRTRDTLRQDVIDQSQLVRALAFIPTGGATNHLVFDHMFSRGVVIDPAKVYYVGQSLGAIQGTLDVATNPRISKAAFNVGGGTIVDIFTTSPAFAARTAAILTQLGIKPNTPEFLQFLVVAKTVLDPADPINFAGHLTDHTLPNLLADPTGGTAQLPKKILTQIANCDLVVPNPFSFVHASNIPTSPLLVEGGFGGPGTFQLFVPTGQADIGNCANAPSRVNHAFLTDWSKPFASLSQNDIVTFMKDGITLGLRAP